MLVAVEVALRVGVVDLCITRFLLGFAVFLIGMAAAATDFVRASFILVVKSFHRVYSDRQTVAVCASVSISTVKYSPYLNHLLATLATASCRVSVRASRSSALRPSIFSRS